MDGTLYKSPQRCATLLARHSDPRNPVFEESDRSKLELSVQYRTDSANGRPIYYGLTAVRGNLREVDVSG
jgi:hypothetical protein